MGMAKRSNRRKSKGRKGDDRRKARWTARLPSDGAALGLIVLLAFVIYGNSLENPFHYDDEHSIVDNLYIRDLSNIPAFFTSPYMFSATQGGMYRPVLLISYGFNYYFGGYEVLGYHLVNLSIHMAGALLVYWLASLTLGSRRIALFAGLIFAAHPANTEVVNYISSRSESLAGLFYLLAFCLFLRARMSFSGRSGSRRGPTAYYTGSVVCYGLCLLTKSIGITLPTMLMIYDLLFLCDLDWRKWGRRFVRHHLAYVAVAFIYVVAIRFIDPSVVEKAATGPVREYGEQILTQIKGYVYYIKLLLLPIGLNVEHQFFVSKTFFEWAVVFSFLLLASILYLSFRAVRFSKLVPFSVLWFYICLAPSSLIPLNVLVNERRLYLPCVAFSIFLGMLLGRKVYRGTPWLRGDILNPNNLAMVLLVLFYSGSVWQRNVVWGDGLVLWGDAVAKAPGMFRARNNLGKAYQEKEMWEQARAEYQESVRIKPDYVEAHYNLGKLYQEQELLEEAGVAYRRALEIAPGFARAHNNLGNLYYSKGLLDRAAFELRQALRIRPDHPETHYNLGNVYQDQGMLDEAEAKYRTALKLRPDYGEAYNNLGLVYQSAGQFDRALIEYRNALRVNPRYASAHTNLGTVYQGKGMLDEAASEYERALAINPNDAGAWYNLGVVYEKKGWPDRAISMYRQALKVNPKDVEARYNLAHLYRDKGDRERALQLYREFIQLWKGDRRYVEIAQRNIDKLLGR